jgi:hypothetical protein
MSIATFAGIWAQRAIHVAFPAVSLSYPSQPSFHHDNPRQTHNLQPKCPIVPSATPILRVCFGPSAVRRMIALHRSIRPGRAANPREIDMMAIGLFSKAFAGPPVRHKVTTEIKEGA